MSTLAINATKWFDSNWAYQNGLFADVFESTELMDKHINELSLKIAQSYKKATSELKKTLWQGTENWDELLIERAKISGKLILSEFSKNAIQAIQKK